MGKWVYSLAGCVCWDSYTLTAHEYTSANTGRLDGRLSVQPDILAHPLIPVWLDVLTLMYRMQIT